MICNTKAIYLGYKDGVFEKDGKKIQYRHVSITSLEDPTETIITTIQTTIDVKKLVPLTEYNITLSIPNYNGKYKIIGVSSI